VQQCTFKSRDRRVIKQPEITNFLLLGMSFCDLLGIWKIITAFFNGNVLALSADFFFVYFIFCTFWGEFAAHTCIVLILLI
jgi:hypothetical protein